MVALNEQALDEKLSELEQARQWSPRVISKLETLIRTGSDLDLFRINPIQYAADRAVAEQEAIDLFLFGTKLGLFEMNWHLLCAFCGQVVHSLRSMSRLHSHYSCNCCSLENDGMLDDLIQVAFTISPRVRDITYHHPENLPIEEFCWHYHKSRDVAHMMNGMSFEEFGAAITRHMSYLEPGETKVVEFDVQPGLVSGADFIGQTRFAMHTAVEPTSELQNIKIRMLDGSIEGVDPILVPQRIEQFGKAYDIPASAPISTGKTQIEFTNAMSQRSALWLYHIYSALGEPGNVTFKPLLTGKRLLNTQTFRDLFRSEVIQSDEGLGVRDITFMFTDLKGSTALYDQIGDAKAYYLVRQHFDTLGRVIGQNNGAIVKTIGDAVMATFNTPADAIKAALAMLGEIEEFNKGISEKLILKIGLHRGHSIAVTLNDKVDYFGQTVNIASRIQNLAGAGEICISDTIYGAQGLDTLLGKQVTVTPEDAMLKGVGEKVHIYRITVGVPVAQAE
jgi:class 3 adenylate cyclase